MFKAINTYTTVVSADVQMWIFIEYSLNVQIYAHLTFMKVHERSCLDVGTDLSSICKFNNCIKIKLFCTILVNMLKAIN